MKSLSHHYIKILEKKGQLIRIKEKINPELEMASVHLKYFKENNKAILFENVQGTSYSAISNLFGSLKRSRLLFKEDLQTIKDLIDLRNNPIRFLKHPFKTIKLALKARFSIPKKVSFPKEFKEIRIDDLPQIKSWPDDGGAFITLPQVYSEDIDKPGVLNSNLGMYRIQLNGNDYIQNKEVGLHYQIHRGIGVHQAKSNSQDTPLKVSIFIGGHPSHTFAAVMPLPEGISELTFAGILSRKRFRYARKDDYVISADADFVICGEVYPNDLKPEGPFGDHLGYYSLKHDFPVLKVHKVYAKEDGVWPFTVVGRPPQEDSQFGLLIHEITKKAIVKEIPGLISINAVDASGVHPLLLAIGSERYTPYQETRKPQEILTIANHILGKGQLSLAKYLFIIENSNPPDINDIKAFFSHFLERVDWKRDMHFQTKTTIDTLDYSGDSLNEGSKVVLAAAGSIKRELTNRLPSFQSSTKFKAPNIVNDGILAIESEVDIADLVLILEKEDLKGIALITVVNDSNFVSKDFNNWLWVIFTRSNPAVDIYGLNSLYHEKHYSCDIPVIDAREKPHHAPLLKR